MGKPFRSRPFLRNCTALTLYAFSVMEIAAQSMTVRGKITNSSGQAVNQALVELIQRGLKDTTGTDGNYQFTGSVSIRKNAIQVPSMVFENGLLQLALIRSAPITVEVFDLHGNRLRHESDPHAQSGKYQWDFSTRSPSKQMMVIRVSIGSETQSFRYSPTQSNRAPLESMLQGFTSAEPMLAKVAAAVDTIRVTATGYAMKKIPIGTWDTTANIMLETITASTGRSAGCGKTSTLRSGKGLSHTPAGGQVRTYNLRMPEDYDNNTPYRLIVTPHWLGGTANQVSDGGVGGRAYYGLWDLANPTGAKGTTIFIAPQGLSNSWPSGNVPFITSLVNMVKSELCIDTTRIFSTGFSMGGSMSYALACGAPDMFRAVAVHAGGAMSGCDRTNRKPVAYFMTHGTNDSTCTYPSFGVPQVNDFASLNGCQAINIPNTLVPTDRSGMNPSCADFQGCRAGYPTRACIFVGGHTPSPGGSNSWVPSETWKFFSQF